MALGEQDTLTRAIHAGTWSVLGLVAQKLVGLCSFFVLARLLTPNDYGVITVVLMVAGVLDTLSTPGFERALIQRQGDVQKYLHAFWTFNLVRSILLAAAIFFAAPFIASFFHLTDPLALIVVRYTGLIIVIQSLGNMGNLFFFKDLSFNKLFARDIGGQLAFSLIAIGYALYHPTVLALFFGFLAQNIASVIIQYSLHPHRPRVSLHFASLADLAWYGGWVMAQNVLNQVNSILETVIVGKMLGPTHLGLYSRAISIASLPSSVITSVVHKVGFPTYAKVQESTTKVVAGFLKSFDIALILLTAFVPLLIFEGERLVEIFLGETWLPMVGAMQILAVSFFVKGFITLMYPLMEGVGRISARFKISLIQSVLLFGLLFYLVPERGIQGAALATLITFLCAGVITAYWTFRNLPLQLSHFLHSITSVAWASGTALLAGVPLHLLEKQLSTTSFLVYIAILGIVYGTLLVVCGRRHVSGPYRTVTLIWHTLMGK